MHTKKSKKEFTINGGVGIPLCILLHGNSFYIFVYIFKLAWSFLIKFWHSAQSFNKKKIFKLSCLKLKTLSSATCNYPIHTIKYYQKCIYFTIEYNVLTKKLSISLSINTYLQSWKSCLFCYYFYLSFFLVFLFHIDLIFTLFSHVAF